jgi:DNA (cytosine-5)-methyltransferase 1
LEAEGYEVWPYVLPAVSVNAPHRRDRVWFVAHSNLRRGCREKGVGQYDLRGSKGKESYNNIIKTDKRLEQWENARPTPHPNGVRLQQCEDSGKMGGGQAEMGRQGSEFTNAIETNGEESTTPHPNGNGLNQRNGNDEKQPGKGGEYALGNAHTGNEYGDVADTDSRGLEGSVEVGRNCEYVIGENGTSSQTGDAADTDSKRGQKCNISGKSIKSFIVDRRTNENPRDWQNFPTQSPICSRNDGLSSRLDGITFSKWRNESIKAAGNAIVPQVVLMIFKAIQQYETTSRMADPL